MSWISPNRDVNWDTRRRRVDAAWISGMAYLVYVTHRADFSPQGMTALSALITPILLYIGGIISFYVGMAGVERIKGAGGQTVTTTTTVVPPKVTETVVTKPITVGEDEIRPPKGELG